MGGRYSIANNRFSDPCAPRFRVKAFDVLATANRSFYADMKKEHPKLEKYNNVDIAKCIKLFNIRIANEVVNNRNGVRLSEGLGIIVAGLVKMRESRPDDIDHITSEKLGKPVYYQNLHSDNLIIKIKYSNEIDKHMFENHDLWMFEACRNLSRAVSAEVKNGNYNNYIIFNTYQHIAHLFRKQRIEREKVKGSSKFKQQKLEDHDEFAF